MALKAAEIKADYPLPIYNYRVEIDGKAIGFAEVAGIDVSFETFTYKESPVAAGAAGPRVFRMPAQATPAKMTLKKGVVPRESVAALYDWINSTRTNQIDKKDVYVRLCDETGSPVISWKMYNAFPVKLEAPNFKADSNEVAVESIELMGDGVLVEKA